MRRRLGHGRDGGGRRTAELRAPDVDVEAVDVAVEVGVALGVRRSRGRADAVLPGQEVGAVDVVVAVEVGVEAGVGVRVRGKLHAAQ